MTHNGSIRGRAVLVYLSVSAWSARKLDRKVTDEVNEDHGASKNAGRYNKHLFADEAPSHAKAVSAAKAVRTILYQHTLQWTDDGWRLLPLKNFEAATAAIRAARTEFETAKEAFGREYGELVVAAQEKLGDMWNPDDYPSREEVLAKFDVTLKKQPLPDSDFRLDLPDDEVRRIEAEVEERIRQATDVALHDAWARLQTSVKRIHDRLTDSKVDGVDGVLEGRARASIRDSLIDSARETVDILGRLNVTDDPDLEAMRLRVSEELTHFDSAELRDDATARQETARRAAAILATMSEVYGQSGGEEG